MNPPRPRPRKGPVAGRLPAGETGDTGPDLSLSGDGRDDTTASPPLSAAAVVVGGGLGGEAPLAEGPWWPCGRRGCGSDGVPVHGTPSAGASPVRVCLPPPASLPLAFSACLASFSPLPPAPSPQSTSFPHSFSYPFLSSSRTAVECLAIGVRARRMGGRDFLSSATGCVWRCGVFGRTSSDAPFCSTFSGALRFLLAARPVMLFLSLPMREPIRSGLKNQGWLSRRRNYSVSTVPREQSERGVGFIGAVWSSIITSHKE